MIKPSDLDIGLTLVWPPATITLPGPDRDQQDQDSIALGIESLVMVTQRRLGLTEEEAKEHLQKVAEQNQWVDKLGLSQQALAPLPTDSLDASNAAETEGSSEPVPES